MADPFSTVLQTLVQLFRNSTAIAALNVKPSNIIDITEPKWVATDPLMASPAPGQLPEIITIPGRAKFSPYGSNSRESCCLREYLVGITTDTLRVGGEAAGSSPGTLFSVEWALMQTFVGTSPDLGLTNSNVVAVRKYLVDTVSDQGLINESAFSRGARRWTAVIAVTVDMYWMSSAILPPPTAS